LDIRLDFTATLQLAHCKPTTGSINRRSRLSRTSEEL
jgi:hypothetical protein